MQAPILMNLSMDERLKKIAEDGDVDAFYSTILPEDPFVLDRIDQIPIVDTPLHVAASAGRSRFAIEMATLKPSFARKLNPLGFSPMHLALQNGHEQTVRAIIKVDTELVRVKAKGRVTLLHCATEMEKVDLLAEFLYVCPSSVEDLTVGLETAVHVALKKCKLRAFKLLLGWLQWFSDKDDILEWMDEDGNTVLHIATSTNQPEVMKLLIEKVNVNAKNLAGSTAMDIFYHQRDTLEREVGNILLQVKAKRASEITKPAALTLAERFTLGLSFWEKLQENFSIVVAQRPRNIPNDIRNVILVVAILIATATYQASLNPPGGYWQDNFNRPPLASNKTDDGGLQISHRAGEMILNHFHLFLFFVSNSLAFYLSIFTILKVIARLPYFLTLYISSICLVNAYVLAVLLTFPLEETTGNSVWTVLFSVSAAFSSLVALAALLIPYMVWLFGCCNQNSVEKLKRRLGCLH